MKYAIRLFAFLTLFFISSCGNESPSDVAKAAMTCLQNEDFEGYVNLMEDGESLSSDENEKNKATMANVLQEKARMSLKRNGGIKDFKVIKETINNEKGTATIKMEVTYNNGKTTTNNCKLRKGKDDKWYLLM